MSTTEKSAIGSEKNGSGSEKTTEKNAVGSEKTTEKIVRLMKSNPLYKNKWEPVRFPFVLFCGERGSLIYYIIDNQVTSKTL